MDEGVHESVTPLEVVLDVPADAQGVPERLLLLDLGSVVDDHRRNLCSLDVIDH